MEEIDISELTLDEKVAVLMRDLPVPVQTFLQSPERNAIALQLTQKYKLHTDTAGIFERAYIFMLLGVFTPSEFTQELREGGIDESTINGLATDVNELVFKKLREEERTGTPVSAPVRPQVPVMQVGNRDDIPPNLPGQIIPQPPVTVAAAPYVPPAQAPISYAPPMNPPQYIPHPVYIVPAPHPTYQVPQPTPIYSAPTQPAPEYHPGARTMASDMELAAQGHPTNPPVPQQVPVMPQPQYQAPVQQPVVPSPAPHNYPPPTMAPVRLTPINRANTGAPITKEYGSDPYRESIE